MVWGECGGDLRGKFGYGRNSGPGKIRELVLEQILVRVEIGSGTNTGASSGANLSMGGTGVRGRCCDELWR